MLSITGKHLDVRHCKRGMKWKNSAYDNAPQKFDATQRKYITALRPNSTAVFDQKAVAISISDSSDELKITNLQTRDDFDGLAK